MPQSRLQHTRDHDENDGQTVNNLDISRANADQHLLVDYIPSS